MRLLFLFNSMGYPPVAEQSCARVCITLERVNIRRCTSSDDSHGMITIAVDGAALRLGVGLVGLLLLSQEGSHFGSCLSNWIGILSIWENWSQYFPFLTSSGQDPSPSPSDSMPSARTSSSATVSSPQP